MSPGPSRIHVHGNLGKYSKTAQAIVPPQLVFPTKIYHNVVGQYLPGILNSVANHFQRGTEASFGQPLGAEQLWEDFWYRLRGLARHFTVHWGVAGTYEIDK